MWVAAFEDNPKSERTYVGRLLKVAWIRVNLPPLEILVPLQLLRLLSIFFSDGLPKGGFVRLAVEGDTDICMPLTIPAPESLCQRINTAAVHVDA